MKYYITPTTLSKPASTCRTSMFHYKLTKDNSLGSILERVIKGANKYFCSEAADYILSEIRPYLSATDMSLEFASRALDLFLPTHPRLSLCSFEKINQFRLSCLYLK